MRHNYIGGGLFGGGGGGNLRKVAVCVRARVRAHGPRLFWLQVDLKTDTAELDAGPGLNAISPPGSHLARYGACVHACVRSCGRAGGRARACVCIGILLVSVCACTHAHLP